MGVVSHYVNFWGVPSMKRTRNGWKVLTVFQIGLVI